MELLPLTGRVKSWNTPKGYGFISSSQAGVDAFFVRSDLPREARSLGADFLEGRKVAFEADEDAEGKVKAKAVQILATDGKPLAGIITAFDMQSFYGALKCSSLGEDVRFRGTDLPPKAPMSKLLGKCVIFEMQRLRDGKPWVAKMEFQIPRHERHARDFAEAAKAQTLEALSVDLGEEQLSGSVKFYNQRKGYGFIVAPGQPTDIRFGKPDLLVDTVKEGTWVTFVLATGADGRSHARQVRAVGGASTKRSASPSAAGEGDTTWNFLGGPAAKLSRKKRAVPVKDEDDEDEEEGLLRHALDTASAAQTMSGNVLWYTPTVSYGFIRCPDLAGAIYFNRHDLPEDLKRSELKGQAVNFELTLQRDGKLRANKVSMI